MVEMFLVSMLSKLGLDKENICRQLACLKSGVEQDIWLILARDFVNWNGWIFKYTIFIDLLFLLGSILQGERRIGDGTRQSPSPWQCQGMGRPAGW